ncbi:MAG: zf-HC2 domain-containing protein [Longimicrobiales bacterium]|nr:zf-HC2 domain-containing protein [Longimicrobiales bacterium]
MNQIPHTHIPAERLEALLDGALPEREARALRRAVAACPECARELASLETLFHSLEALPQLAPSAAFRKRVLGEIAAPARSRVVSAVLGRRDGRAHAASGELHEFLDGRLRGRAASHLRTHLDRCPTCRGELCGLERVVRGLEALPRLDPSPGFGEAVMASIRVQQMARAAVAPTTRWARLWARVREWRPASGQRWAAALGVGTAPVVVLTLALRAVFSHELVTAGTLLAFLRMKLPTVPETWVSALTGWIAESPTASLAWQGVQAVAGSPTLAAAAATALVGTCIGALWVLYRNLALPRGEEARYANAAD